MDYSGSGNNLLAGSGPFVSDLGDLSLYLNFVHESAGRLLTGLIACDVL